MSLSFESTLGDGRTVEVEYEMFGPDREVGLPHPWAELLSIRDENGMEVELTEREEDRLLQEAAKNYEDREWWYED